MVSMVKTEDAQFMAWAHNFNRAQRADRVARTERIELIGRRAGRRCDRRSVVAAGLLPPLLDYGPHGPVTS